MTFHRRGAFVAPVLCPLLLAGQVAGEKEAPAKAETENRWPTLGATPFPADYELPAKKLLGVSERVAAVIAKNKNHPERESGMEPYTIPAPRNGKGRLKLLPIPRGSFFFGSDHPGEGPPRKVRIEPFWMSETEIPWSFMTPFMGNGFARNKDGTLLVQEGEFFEPDLKGRFKEGWRPIEKASLMDVVSQPTPQYHDLFLSGDLKYGPEYPAMCMTHHAASKFCQWLSAQTGHFYRLPTEAEWEYACRAGSSTAYHFGDDPALLWKYAVYYDDDESKGSNYTYAPVRSKKPNAWGLYDMHGNVSEWVLDGFDLTHRTGLEENVLNPWRIPLKRYPRVAKGGSWDSDPEDCRSASRLASRKEWNDNDINVPRSVWYATDGQHVGFRIVRPLRTPTAKEMHLFWNTDWWDPERNGEDL